MKKILSLVISLVMACSLTACVPISPTTTVDIFLKAVKNGDAAKLIEIYADDEFDLLKEAADVAKSVANEVETDEALMAVYEEKLVPKMLDFDYELSNEQINGDRATVDISVKAYQMGSAFVSFFREYITQAFVLAFSNTSEEELTALAADILSKKLDELTEKTYEKTATLSLVKKDNKWIVDSISGNVDVLDALSGGIVDALFHIE